MRGLIVLLAVVGCGSNNPGGTIDGGPGDDDGGGDDSGVIPDDGMSSCPPGQWCMETSPVAATLLHGVWAVNPGDVFAVGDSGTILRRGNNTWTQMQSGTTQNLRGVWAANANDVWAVGEGGTVLRYNGTSWLPQTGINVDLNAVWGSGPNDVFLLAAAMVFQWNGSTFTGRGLAGEPLSISGTGPNDVWVTGETHRVSHYTGTWTTGINPGAGSTYFSILAVAPNDVWVATFTPQSETLRFNGSTWTPHAASGTAFLGMYAVSANDIWGAGGTRVGHWNGATWTVDMPAGNAVQLFGTHGAGSYVWIVGTDSLILHRN